MYLNSFLPSLFYHNLFAGEICSGGGVDGSRYLAAGRLEAESKPGSTPSL